MATFGTQFIDKINKSKTHDCKRNLSVTYKVKRLPLLISPDIFVKPTLTVIWGLYSFSGL